MGEENSPGMFNFGDVLAMAGRERAAGWTRSPRGLKPGDADQHPVHLRHDRRAQGRDADPLEHRQQREFRHLDDKLTDDDRLCIPVPLYHCFGMSMGTLGCVSKGATMVFPGEGFDAGATLKAVEAERCTGLYGVPTMFVAMLDHPDFKRLRSFQRCAPASWPARHARSR